MTQSREGMRAGILTGDLPDDFLRLPRPADQAFGHAGGVSASPHRLTTLDRSIYSQIEISVAEARLVKNYGVGRMNLYCRVRVGARVELTPTGNSGKNPRWNHNIRCGLHPGVSTLLIEILDQRTFSEDERVAWAHVEIPENVVSGQGILDNWFELNGKQGAGQEGQVKLVLSVTPPLNSQAHGTMPSTMGAPPEMALPQSVLQSQQPIPQQSQPRQQQQQVVRVSREELQSLFDMFPTMERDVVVSVVESSGGDMDAAITNLLMISSTD